MDDILNRCAGLQLSEKEGAEVIIGTPVSESNRVLAGKFFTKRRESRVGGAGPKIDLENEPEFRG